MNKNVMIVDSPDDCAYDVFRCSDALFAAIFPLPGQNIEFIEDLTDRVNLDSLEQHFIEMWRSPIEKKDIDGIHGILFYELRDEKKQFYPRKMDSDLDGRSRRWRHKGNPIIK